MTHDEQFEKFVAAKREREQATVKVTWRKVSTMTGGGWSGLGPGGALVFVEPPDVGTMYRYGRREGDRKIRVGARPTLAQAKQAAAALLGATS